MPSAIEFPFSDDEALPTIPITLSYANFSISANALLDSGSTVNLLPYEIGLRSMTISIPQPPSTLTPLCHHRTYLEIQHIRNLTNQKPIEPTKIKQTDLLNTILLWVKRSSPSSSKITSPIDRPIPLKKNQLKIT